MKKERGTEFGKQGAITGKEPGVAPCVYSKPSYFGVHRLSDIFGYLKNLCVCVVRIVFAKFQI